MLREKQDLFIHHHIDCNSKNVIYIVQLSLSHRRPVDKQTNSSKPTAVSEHSLSNDHNANDMHLIPLELMKSVTVHEKLERHTSSIEVKPWNL